MQRYKVLILPKYDNIGIKKCKGAKVQRIDITKIWKVEIIIQHKFKILPNPEKYTTVKNGSTSLKTGKL